MIDKDGKVEATFYGHLRKIFQEGTKQVDLSTAPDIRTLLNILCNSPEGRERIFDENGNVRKDITILRNGRNILFLNGLDTQLNAGDSVAIFPPTTGG
jgi:molybdopterin synthase sulfur carrier subunit